MSARAFADVKPTLIAWALERARLQVGDLDKRFRKLREWMAGDSRPTLHQLEAFSKRVHAPFGYFFLDEPPLEPLPVPDDRTIGSQGLKAPSPDLIDTLNACQRKQDWYKDYAREQGAEPLEFVGSVATSTSPVAVGMRIRAALSLDADPLNGSDLGAVRRRLVDRIEEQGVLVVVNGIVGTNTHRPLKVEEFRGFTLSDHIAPLIFVNGADSFVAQMFTLLHELAHVWAGQSALSDGKLGQDHGVDEELWANAVAAEALVPRGSLKGRSVTDDEELLLLAREFGVSTQVILRRLFDIGDIGWDDYRARLDAVIEATTTKPKSSSGGNFYTVHPFRTGRRFGRAVIEDAREGNTLYREAYSLLGISSHGTFEKLAESLGVG